MIAGIVQDETYFRELVEPHLGARRHLRRAVGPAERDRLLGGALALLHLISFAEPFGLSVVESLATGTPVVAFGLGSMPELIDHGRTGFLVTDVAGAARGAVERSGDWTGTACRAEVERALLRRADGRRLRGAVRAHRRRGAAGRQRRQAARGRSTNAKRTEASLTP